MRNTLEYPITKNEVIECLKQCQQEIMAKELVGDIRPLCLAIAIQIIALDPTLP